PGPAAIRYPRGSGCGAEIQKQMQTLPLGKGRIITTGKRVAILAFGTVLQTAKPVCSNLGATLADMRFVKPMDEALILQLAEQHELLITLEENAVMGGAGSGVNEVLAQHNVVMPVLNLGIADYYVEHGKPSEMLQDCGLHAEGIEQSIRDRLQLLEENPLTINAS
ncbi:MAG: 1-deoxy-D-xylulose-5-phosphate synthase, partial [Pseudomonadales bacterium]|nr:1-deoxy-D-xylulose-5-phosphate synthase [Pseudomonadales bacterium]